MNYHQKSLEDQWIRANNLIAEGAKGYEFVKKSKGSYFWNCRGRRILDFHMSSGAVNLGHAYPEITKSVIKQIKNGTLFAFSHPHDVQLAQKISDLIPCAEQVAFFSSGSSATSAAVRLARAHTGRSKIVFNGYLGWHDWCQPSSRGVPSSIRKDVLEFKYNDFEGLKKIFKNHGHKIACLIMEPLRQQIPDSNYLKKVARLAKSYGALFILDEIKTGFRVHIGGAQTFYDIKPDLSTFSKALSNGYPLAVLAGKKKIMRHFQNNKFAGTFRRFSPSITAALTTLKILETRPVIKHIWNIGEYFISGFNLIFKEHDFPIQITGIPPMPTPSWQPKNAEICLSFFKKLYDYGVYICPNDTGYISYSHKHKHVEKTLDLAKKIIKKGSF